MKLHLTVAGLLALGLVQGLSAQTTRQATTAPATTRPAPPAPTPISTDAILNRMLRPTAPAKAIQPIPDSVLAPPVDGSTGRSSVGPGAATLATIREGTYIVERVARLTRRGEDEAARWELTFDADGATLRDPPMIILPNQKLSHMVATVEGTTSDYRFRITGMVTEFGGRNYILIEKASAADEPS